MKWDGVIVGMCGAQIPGNPPIRTPRLGRLGLARARWPRGRPTQAHAQGLGQGDVAPVSQGGHDQPLLDAQVLVRILKVGVADRRDDGVVAPVDTHLFQPLEVAGVANTLAYQLIW